MGQKVNPHGLRLGVNKDWQSKWYAKKDYAKLLNNDLKIRDFLAVELKDAAIGSIVIERKKNRTEIKITTAKPGIIIGRGGEDIEKLRGKIKNRANFRTVQKKAIKDVMKAGAVGVKTAVSGRLAGAEMARTEGYTEGTVLLHTIRADIDYATSTARTTYGNVGVKVCF